MMAKIGAVLHISLDGVIERPETWAGPYMSDEVQQEMGGNADGSGRLLLGRITYEEMASYWPDKTAQDSPFADIINNVEKLVASNTLKEVRWNNSSLIQGDVVKEIGRLREAPGKDMVILGSGRLVRSLLSEGLVDEMKLLLFPVVLGEGKRLFEREGKQVPLELRGSRTMGTGVVSLSYVPAGGSAWA